MIHPDLGNGGMAMLVTVTLAEDLGVLPDALPEAIVSLGAGMALALRELQLYCIDLECGEA